MREAHFVSFYEGQDGTGIPYDLDTRLDPTGFDKSVRPVARRHLYPTEGAAFDPFHGDLVYRTLCPSLPSTAGRFKTHRAGGFCNLASPARRATSLPRDGDALL